jgi:DNA-directed RNA polymerase specialized sigma24 family protein
MNCRWMTFASWPVRPNYRAEAVAGLVEEYAARRARVDVTHRGLFYLVQLVDLDRALARLPLKYWEVVLLHGLIGFDQYATAQLLQISQSAVSKRYRKGVEELHFYINGGT